MLPEGWWRLSGGHAQRMMATITRLKLGLTLRMGVRNVPTQRRLYAAQWNRALKLMTSG